MSDDPKSWDIKHVATLPPEWGSVVKLEPKNGRVIATSETGDTMIIPIRDPKTLLRLS